MRPTLTLLALLALLAACTPTTNDDADASTSADSTSSTAPTTATGAVATTDVPDPTTTPDPAMTADTTDSSDTTDTGSAGFCYGWQGADGPPLLDLHDRDGNLLTAGSELPLECGGQGLFMFGLYPTFGGFTPTGDVVDFKLTVDVDGFNNNPEGHFYNADPVGYWVGCDDIIGGIFGVLPVFPLDNLDDLTALDGKPAQLRVEMPTDGEPFIVDLEVTLSVKPDDSWSFCGG